MTKMTPRDDYQRMLMSAVRLTVLGACVLGLALMVMTWQHERQVLLGVGFGFSMTVVSLGVLLYRLGQENPKQRPKE